MPLKNYPVLSVLIQTSQFSIIHNKVDGISNKILNRNFYEQVRSI